MKTIFVIMCILILAAAPVAAKAWFADIMQPGWYTPGTGQFVGNPLYNDSFRCLGAPKGGQVYEPAHSYDQGYCISLGDRNSSGTTGRVMIGFSTPIYDDPKNPYGLDFIVFGNAYFRLNMFESPPLYADPTFRWQEPAFAEVSQDGVEWYLIRPSILPNALIPAPGPVPGVSLTDTGFSKTQLAGYADCTPTIELPTAGSPNPFSNVTRSPEELYTIPDRPTHPEGFNTVRFDYVSGGGDAFDIADAVVQSAPGVPAIDAFGDEIKANIGWFSYVRLTDAVSGDYFPGLDEISAEIDAVSACRPTMTIGEAKRLDQGDYVFVTDAVVTAVLPDAFFVESPNRSAAMKVLYDTSAAVDGKFVRRGDKMTITGHLDKTGGGFVVPDPMWTCTQTDLNIPQPLGMKISSLSNDLAYGMRVRVWGRKTQQGPGYCVIDDGASSAKLVWSSKTYSISGSLYLTATGICDRANGEAIVRILYPVQDIKLY